MKISFLQAGYCTHPERAVYTKGSWRPVVFPAAVAVIEHPRHGVILFDTGYSERFFAATREFPNRIYRWITPVFLDEGTTARPQLEKLGIQEGDVRHIVLSHFHADHVGGVSDFRRATFHFSRECHDEIRNLRGFSALRKGFLPALLPDDFLERSQSFEFGNAIPNELQGFGGAKDLFGDGSLWLVSLPGHTEGHTGLFVRTQDKDYFLVGDACYLRENYLNDEPSSAVTRLIISSFADYRKTLTKLHDHHLNHKKSVIVPCHCKATLTALGMHS